MRGCGQKLIDRYKQADAWKDNIIINEDIIESHSFNSESYEKNYECKGYIINNKSG